MRDIVCWASVWAVGAPDESICAHQWDALWFVIFDYSFFCQ